MRFTYRLVRFFAPILTVLALAGCGGGAANAPSSNGGAANPTVPSSSSAPASTVSTAVSVGANAPAGHAGLSLQYAVDTDQSVPPAGSFLPTQIRHAYGIDQISNSGDGQIIAIVDAYGNPNIFNDFTGFCNQFNLPKSSSTTPTLSVVCPLGIPQSTDVGWALETSLDVEWSHAIAPNAHILLVIAPSATTGDLFACVDYASQYVDPSTGHHVSQISMSFGASEYLTETLDDRHFIAPGVTYFASSGDGGAGVSYPAASPNCVGVGGTHLVLDAAGDVLAETAWPQSGGGISAFEIEPTFQQEWNNSGQREVPDVSYYADVFPGTPVLDSFGIGIQQGWFRVGGTSVGSPEWAALMAITNSQRASGLQLANAALYQLGSPSTQTQYFRDIVQGSNNLDPPISSGFSAMVGYDLVTGLGSPMAASLVPALVEQQQGQSNLSGR